MSLSPCIRSIASLASRYTQISVLMKVHVGALYEFQQTFRSHSAHCKLTDSAHLEVLTWGAFLLLLRINPASFARPFSSFRVMLGFAVLPSRFFATTDSSFQNTYEYLAILFGLLLSKTLGPRDCVFAVLEDSRSSLAWVLKGRARSPLCRRASIGFSILAVDVADSIYETEYVSSKDNVVCDVLSHDVHPSQLGLDERLWIH